MEVIRYLFFIAIYEATRFFVTYYTSSLVKLSRLTGFPYDRMTIIYVLLLIETALVIRIIKDGVFLYKSKKRKEQKENGKD